MMPSAVPYPLKGESMAQHYVAHGSYNALCGTDMLGRRNSLLDEDPEATTCKPCKAVLEERKEADAPEQAPEYMMADEAYDVRGFADDGEPSDGDDYVDHGGWE